MELGAGTPPALGAPAAPAVSALEPVAAPGIGVAMDCCSAAADPGSPMGPPVGPAPVPPAARLEGSRDERDSWPVAAAEGGRAAAISTCSAAGA